MDMADLLDGNFTAGRTLFRPVSREGAAVESCGNRVRLRVEPEALRLLACEAFHDVNFFLRTSHLLQWEAVLDDPGSSANDRFVAAALLKNAAIAAEGELPSCQDTGTATVIGCKGEEVSSGGRDADALIEGIRLAYDRHPLRMSQVAPVSLFEDVDTRSNLPAQVDLYAAPGREYRFLFIAKGGGSANKTTMSQETRALLEPEALECFLRAKVAALGTAGCPPYHLAVVLGGTSAEANLKVLKLATAGALDHAPAFGEPDAEARAASGFPVRDTAWEGRLLSIARESGFGAQFGGRHLALDARVLRLSRHAASLPVSFGVSCSAHRNALARIAEDGVWLEALDRDPARFLPKALPVLEAAGSGAPRIDLFRPIREVCRELSRHPAGSLVMLSGPLVVARDTAHARLYALLREGGSLPRWFLDHPVYYAGPSKTPPGRVIGSFGPTTAQRMDRYVPAFMERGASLVMLAKGNRSRAVTEACARHGGFYLGTIGGAAALIAAEHIVREEVLDYADLGMEAVRRIEVRNLPAFVVTDDKGHGLYGASPAEG